MTNRADFCVPLEVGADVLSFLEAEAPNYVYLLAHAEDGVLWARVENGQLQFDFAPQGFPPQRVHLRAETLLMARLFGPERELFLWRDDSGLWSARRIEDAALQAGHDYLEENYILQGTAQQSLKVRHYLLETPEGIAYIAASRLVDLVKSE
jgi:hypothetical protein